MTTPIQKLLKHSKNPKFLEEVFDFAKEAYQDKKWLFGHDAYLDHALRMALFLQQMGIDEKTVAAALLYGVADTSLFDTNALIIYEIEKKFGKDIAMLVSHASALNKIYYSYNVKIRDPKLFTEEKNERLRKMFFALAKDVRVIVIKIASRVDGLHRMEELSEERKLLYATETLHIFVPIANRLGLGTIKREMEDLAFQYLSPEKLAWLKGQLHEQYQERQHYLGRFIPKFKKILKHERVPFLNVDSRAKSYWSTYQKLERHYMNFEKLHDLVALRVIVKDVANCYKVLGIIHKHFSPISGQIQDYIAKPKENGYKSLHTTVWLEEGRLSEIQIKTEQMHQEAEHGICAHWAYKEHINLGASKEDLAFAKEVPEFWKHFKIDFYQDQIFTFTPKGDVIVLPQESTPVDFAYAIHSDIGNHCQSAKIYGKIIPLSQTLHNGDVIEIITNKNRQPSYDWLSFVKTGFARSHIKKITAAVVWPIFSVPSLIKSKIFGPTQPVKEPLPALRLKKATVSIAGQTGIAITMAKCCNPKPGDITRAYLTKHRAAVLHTVSCPNLQKLSQKFPQKTVDASWHQN